MSTTKNEHSFSSTISVRLFMSAWSVLLLCSCQALPHVSQLGQPQAKSVPAQAQTSRKPARAAVLATDPAQPHPNSVQKRPVEPSHDEPAAVGQTVSGPLETPRTFFPRELSVPACPICQPGARSLPAAAFGSTACLGDDSSFPSAEEYLCNGGDRETAVIVKPDWRVLGLHQGDTVVHYDTIDGQTHVEPSNDVCLYAPRFAAVRKIDGLIVSQQHDRAAGVELPIGIVQSGEVDEATTVVQPLQPGRKHSVRTMQQFRERQPGEGIENLQRPVTAQDQFLPFENLTIIRRGTYDNSEKARLAARLEAAIAWTSDQAPQILIDNKTAVQIVDNLALQSTYTYELAPGKSRVRVVKIASQQNARSGETVDFTIRFDNVGDREIGNVTLLDRLHDRLELVPNSQSCTLKANFSTEDEEGSPRVLRWEVSEPLPVGQGGIVRFQCRVR